GDRHQRAPVTGDCETSSNVSKEGTNLRDGGETTTQEVAMGDTTTVKEAMTALMDKVDHYEGMPRAKDDQEEELERSLHNPITFCKVSILPLVISR
ncbi:hypothetical protein PFISCL1PPCAC_22062, partial [Pristionchus fissidentatus]